MSQPEESREKTPETDAVLMHPGNDPEVNTAEVAPRATHRPIRAELEDELVTIEPTGDE